MKFSKLLLILPFLLLSILTHAQLDSSKFGFDGKVRSMAKHGNIIYVGGDFQNVGYRTGSFAKLSLSINKPDFNFPEVKGVVNCSAPDGKGGFYIGGLFTKVGDSMRSNLAQIDNKGIVTMWNPKADGEVKAIKLINETVFIGGSFTKMGATTGNIFLYSIAKVNLLPFPISASVDFSNIIPDGNGGWYVSSTTQEIAGEQVGGFAHIDSTGKMVALPFHLGSVSSMLKAGNKLFIGGSFSHVYDKNSDHFVGTSKTTGITNLHLPNINGYVNSIESDGKGGWFIGGKFNQAGDSVRSNIAHIDSKGNLTDFDPIISGEVFSIRLINGKLFVGGDFLFVNDIQRMAVASIDTATGKLNTWNAQVQGKVFSLAASGDTLYLGGEMSQIGTKLAGSLGAVSVKSAKNLNLSLYVDGKITELHLSDKKLYMAGTFTQLGSTYQKYAAAIDIETELVTAWNPNVDGEVKSISQIGNKVFLGGNFINVGNTNFPYLAGVDTATGSNLDTSVNADGPVNVLTKDGNILYIAGDFGNINGNMRPRAAAYDFTNKKLLSWNPGSDGKINDIAIDNNVIALGGEFDHAGGIFRPGLISINSNTGSLTNWAPIVDGPVSTMSLNGKALYIGGSFTKIGSATRNYIGAVDTSTALALSWNPSANSTVYSVVATGKTIYAAGSFTKISGNSYSYFAAIDSANASATNWNLAPNGYIYSMALDGTTLYAGGDFTKIGSQSIEHFAAYNTTNGTVFAPAGIVNKTVYRIQVYYGKVYFSGSFDKIGIDDYPYFAVYDPSASKLSKLELQTLAPIQNFAIDKGKIFIQGVSYPWDKAGITRNYFAAVSAGNGELVWPNLAFDNEVTTIDGSAGTLYVGGEFNRVGSTVRHYLAALTIKSKSVSTWNPIPNDRITTLKLNGNRLYIAGDFTEIANTDDTGFVAIDTANGQNIVWSPELSTTIYTSAIHVAGGKVYLGGYNFYSGSKYYEGLIAFDEKTAAVRFGTFPMNGIVRTIASYKNKIYAGGNLYDSYNLVHNLFSVDSANGKIDTIQTGFNAIVKTLHVSGDTLIAGGDFSMVNPVSRNGLAGIYADSLKLTPFTGYSSLPVEKIALSQGGDTLYFAMELPTGNYYTRQISAYRISTNTGTGFKCELIGNVNTMAESSSGLIVGGNISVANSTSVKNLFMVSKSTYKGVLWSPNVNNTVYDVSIDEKRKRMYVAGGFTSINSSGEPYFQAFNYSYGTPSNVYTGLYFSDTAKKLLTIDSTVYVAGDFTHINGYPRNYVAAINPYRTFVKPFNPRANGRVLVIDNATDNILVNGEFTKIGNKNRRYIAKVDTTNGNASEWEYQYLQDSPFSDIAAVGKNIFGLTPDRYRLIVLDNTVKVDNCPQKKIIQIAGDTICNGNDGKITVIKSLAGVTYRVTVNGKSTNITSQGTGSDVAVTIPANLLTQTFSKIKLAIDGMTQCDTLFTTDTATIWTIPTMRLGFITDNSCSQTEVSFKDTSKVSNGSTWFWNFGDNTTSTLQNPTHKYNTFGTYIAKLIVTNQNGCKDSVTRNIIINQNLGFVANNACAETEVAFKDTSKVLSASTWLWNFGDNNSSTLQNPTHKYATSGTYSVQMIVSHGNGCKDSISKNITIYTKPVSSFDFTGDLCIGSNLTFTDKSTISVGNIASWTWNFGDGNTASAKNTSHKFTTAGTYDIWLKVVSNNGCVDSFTKQITISELPTLTITHVTNQQNVSFTVSDNSYASYKWNFGDGNTSTDINPNHSYAQAGTYTITLNVINAQGCQATFTDTVSIIVNSINEFGKAISAIEIYPNPFKDQTVIKYYLPLAGNVSIVLYDVNGKSQTLMTSTLLPSGPHAFILDADKYKLNSGVYIIRIENNASSIYRRIIRLK